MNERQRLLERLEAAQPALQRLLAEAIPPEVHSDLGTVTLPQLRVLSRLTEAGALTIHELASCLGVGTSAVSQMVERLVRLGLVERTPGDHDRRLVRVRPTQPATTLSRRFAAARRQGTRRVLAALSNGELAQYVALTERMVERADTPAAVARRRTEQPTPAAG